MVEDPEISAMSTVKDALDPLEPEAVDRVLHWAAKRFAVEFKPSSPPAREKDEGSGEERSDTSLRFDRLADLYHAANPSTQQERLLVAGYWFQELQGQGELTAREINTELKHLGRKVTNITRAFSRLEDKDPALAMQVRKTGSSKQAHKIYRLTEAGIRYVEDMLPAPTGQ